MSENNVLVALQGSIDEPKDDESKQLVQFLKGLGIQFAGIDVSSN